MRASVADHPFHAGGGIDQLVQVIGGLIGILQLGKPLEIVGNNVPEWDGLGGNVRDDLGHPVHFGERDVHHAAHVPQGGARPQRAEGDDLRHLVLPIFIDGVIEHFGPAVVGEVQVDIGHRDAPGVQEAFEEQFLLDGIHQRDIQRISHDRTVGGAAGVILEPHLQADEALQRAIVKIRSDPLALGFTGLLGLLLRLGGAPFERGEARGQPPLVEGRAAGQRAAHHHRSQQRVQRQRWLCDAKCSGHRRHQRHLRHAEKCQGLREHVKQEDRTEPEQPFSAISRGHQQVDDVGNQHQQRENAMRRARLYRQQDSADQVQRHQVERYRRSRRATSPPWPPPSARFSTTRPPPSSARSSPAGG